MRKFLLETKKAWVALFLSLLATSAASVGFNLHPDLPMTVNDALQLIWDNLLQNVVLSGLTSLGVWKVRND